MKPEKLLSSGACVTSCLESRGRRYTLGERPILGLKRQGLGGLKSSVYQMITMHTLALLRKGTACNRLQMEKSAGDALPHANDQSRRPPEFRGAAPPHESHWDCNMTKLSRLCLPMTSIPMLLIFNLCCFENDLTQGGSAHHKLAFQVLVCCIGQHDSVPNCVLASSCRGSTERPQPPERQHQDLNK